MLKFLIWLSSKLPEIYQLYLDWEKRQIDLLQKEIDEKDRQAIIEAWEKQDAEALKRIFNNDSVSLREPASKG